MSKDSSNADNQYAVVKWGPLRGFLAVLLAFAGGQVLALILIIAGSTVFGSNGFSLEDWVNKTAGQFVFVVMAEVFTLGIIWLVLQKRISLQALGFSRRPKWSDPGWTLVAALVYLIAVLILSGLAGSVLGVDVDQKQEIGFDAVAGGKDMLLALISLVILPPLVEEILFRGVLFGGFRKKMPFIWAALFTSILFAMPHLMEGKGSLLWIGGIDTFVLSLALCYLREKTGSLWASIFLHMLKNSVAYLALFVFVSN